MTTKPKLLTRDEILAAEDRSTETVDVPEWGGQVTIRPLTGTERDHYERSLVRLTPNDSGGFDASAAEGVMIRGRLAALSIVDADGKRMFSDVDMLALGEKSARALDRVFNAASRLSGLSRADVEALTAGLKGDRNGSTGSG
jgi:hypothetical protein